MKTLITKRVTYEIGSHQDSLPARKIFRFCEAGKRCVRKLLK